MASWQPNKEGVQQIYTLLTESQRPGVNQGQVAQQLKQCNQHADFNNYLAFILAQGGQAQIPEEVRQAAGLVLKNNLKQHFKQAPADLQAYIKLALLHALQEDSRQLRRVVGTCVAAIVAAAGLPSWPELLQALVRCLDSADLTALEAGLDTLHKICEDSPKQLQGEVAGVVEQPATLLIPRLLRLFKSPLGEVRVAAVNVMNLMAEMATEPMHPYVDAYLAGLFSLAEQGAPELRRAVCAGLVQLLHLQPDCLLPHMSSLIKYMLEATQDGDQGVALESCEFWTAFCEASVAPELLQPHLGTLIPVLLRNMVYDEDDEEVLDAEAAEHAPASANGHRKDQDLKPFINRSAAAHGEGEGQGWGDEGEGVRSWNLRKCSAAGLDVLSTVFGQDLLPMVVPVVQQRLQDPDWRARESAILALGAISEGCAMGMVPYLPQLVQLLLPKLSDPRPLVRSISCWALSRYSHWIGGKHQHGAQEPEPAQLQLAMVLKGLLERVLDHNSCVQEAACSALAILEENCSSQELLPHLQAILQTQARALACYSRRTLRILYDSLSTLAEAVGQRREAAAGAMAELAMPPLMARWEATPDSDRELLPLLACCTPVVAALGERFAPQLFARAARIMQQQLAAAGAQAAGAALGVEPDKEFITCSLDLLSGLAEGLGPAIEPLVAASQLGHMLLQCCQDPSPDVRQSAFALVGDLAKVCPAHLQPGFATLAALCLASLEGANITLENMSACNNACWSLGELAVKSSPAQLQPFAPRLAELLLPILESCTVAVNIMPRSIIENSAITLGRVAWVCPASIAPALGALLLPWCTALRGIRDDVEKEHAFLGLCAMLRINPNGAVEHFPALCEAFASWNMLRSERLQAELRGVLQLFRQGLNNGSWAQALSGLAPPVREKVELLSSN